MARMLLEAAASGSVEDSLNSDLVVILAGLLCALICVLGLGLMPPGERCGRCGARSGGRGIGALLLNYWKAPACDAEGPELA
uniref:Uncharacterized protein n=1 Tax=Oryza glumipatula TaxID=40148 RepID=A0A0D9YWK5_9ORYZ